MHSCRHILVLACLCTAAPFVRAFNGKFSGKVNNILLISVDGMHTSDLRMAKKMFPTGGFAMIANKGITYTDALTQAGTDSFPGLLSLVTGGTQRSHGVYYDVSYDRTLYPVKDKTCSGPPGTAVVLDESLTAADGVSIDPAMLPNVLLSNGTCQPFYPHSYPRINNIFTVIKKAGGSTHWSDKHAAYDLVQGANGNAIDDFYSPEINSLTDTTFYSSNSVHTPMALAVSACNGLTPKPLNLTTTAYDHLKVEHVLEIIEKLGSDTPTVFGMNFQSVSIAQKTSDCGGGYTADLRPGTSLTDALKFVDDSLAQFVAAIEKAEFADNTVIIVTAKHGQSPIDRTLLSKVNDTLIADAVGDNLAALSTDTAAFVWLKDASMTSDAVHALRDIRSKLRTKQLWSGESIREMYWTSPGEDSRVPDIVLATRQGTVFTTKATKIAEHGGFDTQERRVALIVSGAGIPTRQIMDRVYTMQVAPTILSILGLDFEMLDAVEIEGTEVLPGFRKAEDGMSFF